MKVVVHITPFRAARRLRFLPDERRAPAASHFEIAALAASSLLTPCALLAFTFAFWRIGADLRWTSSFFVSRGLFSHWQIWLASAAVLLIASRVLNQNMNTHDS